MNMRRLVNLLLILLMVTVSFPQTNESPTLATAIVPTITLMGPTEPQPVTSPSIDVQVVITGTTNLAAFEFDLVYDRTLVEVTGITLGDFLGETSGCDPGMARCVVGLGPLQQTNATSMGTYSYGTGPGANGDGLLGTIHLQPTGAAGTTSLSLTNALIADVDVINPESPATNGTTLVLADTRTLYLPIIVKPPATQAGLQRSQAANITSGNKVASGTTHNASIPAPPPTNLTAGGQASFQPITPYLTSHAAVGGSGMNPDINVDGRFDIIDIQLAAICWGQLPSAPGCSPAMDLNSDGLIDTDDISLVAARWHIGLATIVSTSPANGAGDVAVTRETITEWSLPLDATTVLSDTFSAQFGGQMLSARLHVSPDGDKVTMFYDQPLPSSARVRVTVNSDSLVDAQGYAVDADGDGLAGGAVKIDFDTLSLTTLPGTIVCGTVFASELDVSGGGGVDVPLEGVTITVDGREAVLNAVTDANGEFCMDPVPAGRFFVHIDGRTASNGVPSGAYYPFVGKAWESKPGQTVDIGNVYLPLVVPDTLQPVSQTSDTTIHFPPSVIAEHPEFADVVITVPADSLYADDGTRGGMVGIAPVPPDRLPGPLRRALRRREGGP